jgi:hypothetical protein
VWRYLYRAGDQYERSSTCWPRPGVVSHRESALVVTSIPRPMRTTPTERSSARRTPGWRGQRPVRLAVHARVISQTSATNESMAASVLTDTWGVAAVSGERPEPTIGMLTRLADGREDR